MSLIDKDMKGHHGKTRYQSSSFLQDAILCFVNYFLSFPKNIEIKVCVLLYSNEYHRSSLVYHSLQIVDIPSSCILYLDQGPSSNLYDVHDQSCEPYEIKVDIRPPLPSLISSNIQERYIPLKL